MYFDIRYCDMHNAKFHIIHTIKGGHTQTKVNYFKVLFRFH